MRNMRNIGVLLLAGLLLFTGCGRDSGSKDSLEQGDELEQSEVQELEWMLSQEEASELFLTATASCQKVYESLDKGTASNVVLSEEDVHSLVQKLAEAGYAATCASHDMDLSNFEALDSYLTGGSGDTENYQFSTIYTVSRTGIFHQYVIQRMDENLKIMESAGSFDSLNQFHLNYTESYQAYSWEYTEKGWLIFERELSQNQEMDQHIFLRILPLGEEARQFASQYIIPISYFSNNLFLTNWNLSDFGEVEWNDVYECFYGMEYGEELDEASISEGIPAEDFESLIQKYVPVDTTTLREMAGFNNGRYPWEAVGYYNRIQQFQPFPEVTKVIDNGDGTITLQVEGVFVEEGMDSAFTHVVTLRENAEGYQYIGNQIIEESIEKIPSYAPRRSFGEEE